MQQDLVALAFAAGLVAALNPCGFAMLPAYLALVVQACDKGGAAMAVGRAVAATVAMTLGFLTVFGTFGLLTVSLASTVQKYIPYVTVLIGIALVVLGVWLLSGRELTLLVPNQLSHSASRAPTRRLGSMFGYGVGYAIASLSCTVGPFLAVTGAGVGGTSVFGRASVYVAYAAGFALVVGASALTVALAGSAFIERMRRILPYVNRIGGAVLILVGLYVGYYGYYEARLFTADGNPADPVIAVAGRLQGALAGWVHRHGAWPWIALLSGLALAAVLLARHASSSATSRRRPSRGGPATAGDEP
ncbi:MAG: cytochrome c biogenesis CcdA family protein [Mycobacterium sp.]